MNRAIYRQTGLMAGILLVGVSVLLWAFVLVLRGRTKSKSSSSPLVTLVGLTISCIGIMLFVVFFSNGERWRYERRPLFLCMSGIIACCECDWQTRPDRWNGRPSSPAMTSSPRSSLVTSASTSTSKWGSGAGPGGTASERVGPAQRDYDYQVMEGEGEGGGGGGEAKTSVDAQGGDSEYDWRWRGRPEPSSSSER